MDKERLMNEAKEFNKEGYGYRHSEMKDGKAPRLVMCGDTFSVMWMVCGIINRLAEITKNPFNETAYVIMQLHQTGYQNVKSMLKGTPYKTFEGENFEEKWKAEKEKEIRREVASDSITLALNLTEMQKKNTSLNNQLVDLKKDYTKKLKTKDDEIKKLNKEILALEHRMKEMEEQRLFPFREGN